MKYLKEYEIFEQKFAFDSNKESLLKMIANIKKGNNYDFYFKNIIYSVIVGDRAFSDMFDDNIKNEWKNYFMNKCFISDGVWSQRTFNSKYRIGNDMTYNYYITITKEKNNIFNFVDKLKFLDDKLSELSDKYKECVSYKTHTILDMMVSHNDSLKVFYYNPYIKNKIEEVVKKWVIDNNIKLNDRIYYHGVDTKNSLGEKDSFGGLVSERILDVLKTMIKKYGDKYSDEMYYKWLVQNMCDIIKDVKIKY